MIAKKSKILLLVISAVLMPGPVLEASQQLQVLQTNANNGYLFPCKCPSEPKGGLAKRATLIKQLAAAQGQRSRDYLGCLLFDSGDIWNLEPDRRTDSLVLAAYQAMGYQALALGDQELSRGVDYFLELSGKFKLHFLSANLRYRGQPLVPGHRIIEMKGVRVAVVGLLGQQVFKYYQPEVFRDLEIQDPEAVLGPLLDELGSRADVILLLSHLGYEKEQEIAAKFPGLALIIGGHTQNELHEADERYGVPIVEAGSKAAWVTQAWLEKKDGRWRFQGSKLWGINSDLPDDPGVTAIIGTYVPRGHASVRVQGSGEVAIEFFYSPECPDCEKIKSGLLTDLVREYLGRLKVIYRNVEDPLEYQRLLELEKNLNDRNNQIPAVYVDSKILGGMQEIQRDLKSEVKKILDRPKSGSPSRKDLHVPAPAQTGGSNDEPDSIFLAFVSDQRCPRCSRAEYMLRALSAKYPRLSLRKYYLTDNQGRLMAEALGLAYGVPEELRLKAPLAYVGEDFLAGQEVDDQKLDSLITRYQSGTEAPWERAEKYLDQARGSLISRFHRFGLWGVLAAGLLDGINPCALSVLVFFISYLTFVGRRRWEILAVGISYTLADFLVYFAIGIGALSFLMGLKTLPLISRFLYWLAVAVGLALAVYNFRDYLKARRGDYAGMELQLSTRTKQRVHRIIRERMSAGSLIFGAFVVGLLTSVLEFACTGQIYLPTLAFVTQIASEKLRAYGLLLFYNLAFEIPMVAVFLVAFWGVSSKKVAAWAEASVSGVKLATAGLFLAMSCGLLYLLLK